jgi:hypothetical protein
VLVALYKYQIQKLLGVRYVLLFVIWLWVVPYFRRGSSYAVKYVDFTMLMLLVSIDVYKYTAFVSLLMLVCCCCPGTWLLLSREGGAEPVFLLCS